VTPLLGAILLLLAGAEDRSVGACHGKISGAVERTFRCVASISTSEGGQATFEVRPLDRLDGVPSYAPGAFELPEPIVARSFTLDDLGLGRASVALEGGTLYTATKTSGQRGEVELVLTTVTRSPASPGAYDVHGSYRARLPPVGSGKKGEIVVEVSF